MTSRPLKLPSVQVSLRTMLLSGTSQHCTSVGSVVGCARGFGVLFPVMSGTSEHCMLGSAVGYTQGFRVLVLAMPCTPQHCMLVGSVFGCVLGVLFLAMSGTSELHVGQCCRVYSGV